METGNNNTENRSRLEEIATLLADALARLDADKAAERSTDEVDQ